MKTNSNSTTSNTDSTTPTEINPVDAENTNAPATDDFGYDDDESPASTPVAENTQITKEDDDDLDPVIPDATKPAEVKKPEAAAKVEDNVEDLTGYGKKPEAAAKPAEPVVPPEPKTPEELTEEEKAKGEISSVLGDAPASLDKEKITQFALKHKLTKDQVSAYVQQAKADDAAAVKAATEARDAQRKQWNEELVADPDFGGENYEKSVHNINRLLANNMPNTKKALTDKKGMLPPYLMRDLSALFKALNPTTKLVVGDSNETKVEKHYLDEMYE